ncbi:unnamed protein product [Hydatigera taeniaeformis]|uniref:Uncharacterized protein n=1 Tax=Hydatigena taeniaeformis TaxID=6205 RepID=A0A3P7F8K2_HYDTA|nr:unnamed protein product [Hydatigera taeniaeformis]
MLTGNWDCDPMEVVRTFAVPQGTKTTGQSEVFYVDWRRFVVAAVLRGLNLSSDQIWVGLHVLWSFSYKIAKSTLVGLCVSREDVKNIIYSEGFELESRGCDLLIGLFEMSEEEERMVKMDDLVFFLSASGCSSPFDSLVRSLAALENPTLPLPTPQATQVLHE